MIGPFPRLENAVKISNILRPRVSFKVIFLAAVVYLVVASILVIVAEDPPDSAVQSPSTPTNTFEAPETFPEPNVAPIFERTLPRIDLPIPPYKLLD